MEATNGNQTPLLPIRNARFRPSISWVTVGGSFPADMPAEGRPVRCWPGRRSSLPRPFLADSSPSCWPGDARLRVPAASNRSNGSTNPARDEYLSNKEAAQEAYLKTCEATIAGQAIAIPHLTTLHGVQNAPKTAVGAQTPENALQALSVISQGTDLKLPTCPLQQL